MAAHGNLAKKYNSAHTNTIRSTFILVSLVCRRVRWPELWPRCRNRTPLISNHFAGSPIHYAITRRDGLCVRSGTRRSAGPTTAMAAARTLTAITASSKAENNCFMNDLQVQFFRIFVASRTSKHGVKWQPNCCGVWCTRSWTAPGEHERALPDGLVCWSIVCTYNSSEAHGLVTVGTDFLLPHTPFYAQPADSELRAHLHER